MIMERKQNPSAELRARHIDFLRVNFSLLARVGFAGWLTQGRGIVVVEEASFINEPKGILAKIRMCYVGEKNPELQALLGPKEKVWVKTYDPNTTLLVSYSRTDGGVSSYQTVGQGENTPKAIYERSSGHDPQSDSAKL